MTPPSAAFHSSLCLSSQVPSSSSPLSPSPPSSSSHQLRPSSTPKPQSLLHNHPLYAPTHSSLSLQFKEKILCLEVMGIDSGKALSQNPCLQEASLESIQSIISFLRFKGIHQKDLARIFGMCPKVLTSNMRTDLNPVFNFLAEDLKVPEENFRKAINKCPRLLVSSVKDQLKPALFYLKRLGFEDLDALAYQDPILLVSSVENTLIPKLNFLVSLGFSRFDAIEMVLRCPALFTFSIDNNFKPKYEYYAKEMEGNLEELKEFPQYFAFSLENRIKPRHLEAAKQGLKLPLASMLKSTDEEFRELLVMQGGG